MQNQKRAPGRPPHIPGATDRRLVLILAAEGVPQAAICPVLDVSEKTLRRYYRRELDIGSAKLEAALVGHLLRLASGSDDGVALRAIRFVLQCKFGWSPYMPPPPRG
ncbi:helix-turn-helix domain-containing protein [Rhizobium leguminosarum bv. viciae]|uniref:helix-turn-helix domain-containing protein n=1 Tax=Rhizobium leguminosarum TaxID=384 RepID=UPI00103885BC|nr:helix-turn-helix domain-containing protein [Rhizobium leguminosarum]TBZ34593.1 helix-turn-helix domain-containing protein [Rhizobium leguminosarum bv. viciae]